MVTITCHNMATHQLEVLEVLDEVTAARRNHAERLARHLQDCDSETDHLYLTHRSEIPHV